MCYNRFNYGRERSRSDVGYRRTNNSYYNRERNYNRNMNGYNSYRNEQRYHERHYHNERNYRNDFYNQNQYSSDSNFHPHDKRRKMTNNQGNFHPRRPNFQHKRQNYYQPRNSRVGFQRKQGKEIFFDVSSDTKESNLTIQKMDLNGLKELKKIALFKTHELDKRELSDKQKIYGDIQKGFLEEEKNTIKPEDKMDIDEKIEELKGKEVQEFPIIGKGRFFVEKFAKLQENRKFQNFTIEKEIELEIFRGEKCDELRRYYISLIKDELLDMQAPKESFNRWLIERRMYQSFFSNIEHDEVRAAREKEESANVIKNDWEDSDSESDDEDEEMEISRKKELKNLVKIAPVNPFSTEKQNEQTNIGLTKEKEKSDQSFIDPLLPSRKGMNFSVIIYREIVEDIPVKLRIFPKDVNDVMLQIDQNVNRAAAFLQLKVRKKQKDEKKDELTKEEIAIVKEEIEKLKMIREKKLPPSILKEIEDAKAAKAVKGEEKAKEESKEEELPKKENAPKKVVEMEDPKKGEMETKNKLIPSDPVKKKKPTKVKAEKKAVAQKIDNMQDWGKLLAEKNLGQSKNIENDDPFSKSKLLEYIIAFRKKVVPIMLKKLGNTIKRISYRVEKKSIEFVDEIIEEKKRLIQCTKRFPKIIVGQNNYKKMFKLYKDDSTREYFEINALHYKKLHDLYRGKEQEFEQRVFFLFKRYEDFFGKTRRFEGSGHQGAVPATAMKLLKEKMGVEMECFASPFNCFFRNFCSAFYDTDAYFGSLGDFFSFYPCSGSFECNPPFVEEFSIKMIKHIEFLLSRAEQKEKPLSFAVVLPNWIGAESINAVHKSKFLKNYIILQKNKHGYISGFQHKQNLRKTHYESVHETIVAFFQSTKGYEMWTPTNEFMKELESQFTCK